MNLPGWLQAIVWASAYASILALMVLLAQPLLRHCVPARWRMALWLLVLIRFLPLPLPESRWSLFNWLPHEHTVAQAAPAPAPTALPIPAPSLVTMLAPAAAPVHLTPLTVTSTPPVTRSTPAPAQPPTSPWPSILAAAYLLGCAAVLARLLLATRSLRRILRRATPATAPDLTSLLDSTRHTLRITRRIPLLLTDDLASPALVGFFRPRLLLPRSVPQRLTPDELRLVFLHECVHLHRRDVLLSYALSLLSIAHWFNPLVWLLLPRLRAERELACDELVLLHTADPTPYGHTLLKLLESAAASPPLAPAGVGIIESHSFFARRIHMIAAFRRSPAWLGAAAALSLAVVAACTLTAPTSRGNGPVAATPVAPPTPVAEPARADTPPVPAVEPAPAVSPLLIPAADSDVNMDNQIASAKLMLQALSTQRAQAAHKDPDGDASTIDLQIRMVQQNLDQLQAQKAAREAAYKRALTLANPAQEGAALAPAAPAPTRSDNRTVMIDDLQRTLRALEQDKAALLTSRGPASPDVQALDARIDMVHEQLATVQAKEARGAGAPAAMDLTPELAAMSDSLTAQLLKQRFEAEQNVQRLMERGLGSQSSAVRLAEQDLQVISRAIDDRLAKLASLAAAQAKEAAAHPSDGPAPVFTGNDPKNVVPAQGAITQIIKLKFADATRLRNDLVPFFSPDATVAVNATSNSLIVTDRADRIHRLLEIIAPLDVPSPQSPDAEPRDMQVFDVHDLIGVPQNQAGPLTPDQRAASEDLVKTINGQIGPGDKVSAFNGNLIVSATHSKVQSVQELLDVLKQREFERRKSIEDRAAASRPVAR